MTAQDGLWFWRMTGFVGTGHITYAPGQLAREGRFTNPARMVEDIMGACPTRGYERRDGRSDSEQQANVWRLAGWWD